jgi:hypothetical protein
MNRTRLSKELIGSTKEVAECTPSKANQLPRGTDAFSLDRLIERSLTQSQVLTEILEHDTKARSKRCWVLTE